MRENRDTNDLVKKFPNVNINNQNYSNLNRNFVDGKKRINSEYNRTNSNYQLY